MIAGSNSGNVTYCTARQCTLMFTYGSGGGIVGYNTGRVTNNSVMSSYITGYWLYGGGTYSYPSGHTANIGGVVGHNYTGSILSNSVTSDTYVQYGGVGRVEDWNLAPAMGYHVGYNQGGTVSGNTGTGTVETYGYLYTLIKYFLGFIETDRHNQAQYVGGSIGRS